MRNLHLKCLVAFCALICPVLAYGQGGIIANPISFTGPTGRPLAGATVTVCQSTGIGFPCSPLASIFTNAGLSIASPNPVTTDGNGNLPLIFAAPGVYVLSVTGSGITPTLVTATVAGTGGGNVVTSAINNFTNTNNFAGATNLNGGGTLSGSFSGPTALTATKSLNSTILYADQFAGADASAKIQAAITALPSTGGIISAIALTDAGGTGSTTIDPGTKAVTVYLGPTTYNFSQTVLRRSFQMFGMGMYAGNGTIIQATGGNAVPPFVIDQGTQATQGVTLSGFSLQGTAGNTTQNGFNLIAQNGLGLWHSEFRDIYITGFGGISLNLDGQVNGSANQFDDFYHVVILRKLNGNYALQIIGFANALNFHSCEFDGQLNTQDGLTNINIAQGAGSVTPPYAITFDMPTVQFAGVGFLINGADTIVITNGTHIENINQLLSVGTGAGFGSLNIILSNTVCSNNCGIGTTPGVGAGNGAIVNNRAATANVSIIVSNFHSLNTPDKVFIGNLGSITSQPGNSYGPEGSYVAISPTHFGTPIVHQAGNTVDTTALGANVASTPIMNVPSTINNVAITGAEYLACGSTVVTTAATTSSTLPNVSIVYADRDSSATISIAISPAFAAFAGVPGQSTNANQGNTTATTTNGCVQISVKAGTTVNYLTSGYASVGGTSMVYALHVRLEALDGL